MTDNRTTELLREGLTERGIEWRSGLDGVTFVGDWCFVEYDNGKLAATCEPVLTPDQAIAATLGSGEPSYDELIRCLENDWHISASWDGLRKFWCIELTEEGVKLRDATHGTLTAEQVRNALMSADRWGKPMGNIGETHTHVVIRDDGWQAIADELNVELGSEINGDTSDGYHTFNELYHHRAVLFSVIVRDHRELAWKAMKHHDGTMYDGMFIVGIETPKGQATYHYDLDPYWEMFDCEEREFAPEWDGHTPDEAIARIAELGSGTCELYWRAF